MYKPQMEDKMAQVMIRNKSDVPLHGLQPGKVIQIEVKGNGSPKDKHWRRRLRDAKIDGCVEIVEEKKIEVKKIIKPKEDKK